MNNQRKRIFLRIQYNRETGQDFSSNIPAYGDWLEKKLVTALTETKGEPVPHFGAWLEVLQEKQKNQ